MGGRGWRAVAGRGHHAVQHCVPAMAVSLNHRLCASVPRLREFRRSCMGDATQPVRLPLPRLCRHVRLTAPPSDQIDNCTLIWRVCHSRLNRGVLAQLRQLSFTIASECSLKLPGLPRAPYARDES
eukprot:5222771-Pleurochrysis_carterae.AAC.2